MGLGRFFICNIAEQKSSHQICLFLKKKLINVSTRVISVKFTFTSHYHFGGRLNNIQLVTGGADGDGV